MSLAPLFAIDAPAGRHLDRGILTKLERSQCATHGELEIISGNEDVPVTGFN